MKLDFSNNLLYIQEPIWTLRIYKICIFFCLVYICHGRRVITSSWIFHRCFRHRRSQLRTTGYVFTLYTIILQFLVWIIEGMIWTIIYGGWTEIEQSCAISGHDHCTVSARFRQKTGNLAELANWLYRCKSVWDFIQALKVCAILSKVSSKMIWKRKCLSFILHA